jgi:hypothetical protein
VDEYIAENVLSYNDRSSILCGFFIGIAMGVAISKGFLVVRDYNMRQKALHEEQLPRAWACTAIQLASYRAHGEGHLLNGSIRHLIPDIMKMSSFDNKGSDASKKNSYDYSKKLSRLAGAPFHKKLIRENETELKEVGNSLAGTMKITNIRSCGSS